MYRIGGGSGPNGITFISDNFLVRAEKNRKGVIEITKKKVNSKFRVPKLLKKIPFVGKAMTVIWQIAILYPVIFFIFLAMVGMNQFAPEPYKIQPNPLISFLFIVTLCGGLIWIIIKSRKYHAAEHKAINTYEKREPLDIGFIRKSSRVADRCGTNLVATCFIIRIAFIFFEPIWELKMPDLLRVFLAFSISMELVDAEKKWASPFLYIGGLAQKYLTTKEPTNSELELARVGLRELIRLEDEFQKNQ